MDPMEGKQIVYLTVRDCGYIADFKVKDATNPADRWAALSVRIDDLDAKITAYSISGFRSDRLSEDMLLLEEAFQKASNWVLSEGASVEKIQGQVQVLRKLIPYAAPRLSGNGSKILEW